MDKSSRHRALTTTALLVGSVIVFAVSPLILGSSYDWVSHTTSEAGAQGIEGAWLGNLGFVLFGLAAWRAGTNERRWVRVGVAVFAACMVGVAVFSTRAWDTTSFDPVEDRLHSFFATLMGFAFAATVVARFWMDRGKWMIDGIAIIASVLLPVLMAVEPDFAGVFQRLMFLIAMVWFGGLTWGPTSAAT